VDGYTRKDKRKVSGYCCATGGKGAATSETKGSKESPSKDAGSVSRNHSFTEAGKKKSAKNSKKEKGSTKKKSPAKPKNDGKKSTTKEKKKAEKSKTAD
jgi:hypothetical protein